MMGEDPKPIREKWLVGWIIRVIIIILYLLWILSKKKRRIAWISADYRGDSNMDVCMTNLDD